MSNKKRGNFKGKKGKFYSVDERRAYWVGVGISAQRHGDGEKLLDSSNSLLRRSLLRGYEDDNHRDVSSKLMNKK